MKTKRFAFIVIVAGLITGGLGLLVRAQQPTTFRVIAINPPNQATNVRLDTTIAVDFSLPVQPATVVVGRTFFLFQSSPLTETQLPVPGRVEFTSTLRRVTFVPDTPLAPNTVYLVAISRQVLSRNQQPLEGDCSLGEAGGFCSVFQTGAGQQFAVTSIYPASGQGDIPRNNSIVVEFSTNVAPASVTTPGNAVGAPPTFLVTTSAGTVIPGVAATSGNRVTYFPETAFPANTDITVFLPANGIRSSEGIALAGDFSSTFTTERLGASLLPPGDGGPPVRVAQGGRVFHRGGTGFAVRIASVSLSRDTTFTLDVMDIPANTVPPGMTQVSPIVSITTTPPESIAFGPGARLRIPLRPAFRGLLPSRTRLRLLQEVGGVFKDTGKLAEVGFSRRFVLATSVETFGRFVLAMPTAALKAALEQPIGDGLEDAALANDALSDDAFESGTSATNGGGSTLYFPVVEQGPSQVTRLFLANPVTSSPGQTASVMLTAYPAGGGTPSTATVTLATGQQQSLSVGSLSWSPSLSSPFSGVIMAHSEDGPFIGSYEISNNGGSPTMLMGGAAIPRPESALIFPVNTTSTGTSTSIEVFNTSSSNVDVTFCAVPLAGPQSSVNCFGVTICAQQKYVLNTNPSGACGTCSVTDFNGYLFAQTDTESLVGAAISGTGSAQRILNGLPLLPGFTLDQGSSCRAKRTGDPTNMIPHTLYAVQFATGGLGQTKLHLVNLRNQPVAVGFRPWTGGGFPIRRGTRLINEMKMIPANGSLTLEVGTSGSNGLFSFLTSPTVGYIQFDVEGDDSGVVGMVEVSQPGQATLVMPLAFTEQPRAFFANARRNMSTTEVTQFQALNPNTNSVGFFSQAFDSSGSGTGQLGTILTSRQRLTQPFPTADQATGYIGLGASNPLPGNDERLIMFAIYERNSGPLLLRFAVPAQVISP